jgi:hypothetical protein
MESIMPDDRSLLPLPGCRTACRLMNVVLFTGLMAGLAIALCYGFYFLQPGSAKPYSAGNSNNQSPTLAKEANPSLLECSITDLDLGTIPKGAVRKIEFDLHNPGDKVVKITQIETSCSCLRVSLETMEIEPGKTVVGKAKIDFSDDDKFVGSLGLKATGLVESATASAFVIKVSVHVE